MSNKKFYSFNFYTFNILFICHFIFNSVYASSNDTQPIIVAHDVKHDISLPIRDMRIVPHPLHRNRIMPILRPSMNVANNLVTDSVLQNIPGSFLSIPFNVFQGIGIGLGSYEPSVAPPDTNGAAGITQYVQWVNEDFAVFDKKSGKVYPGFPKPGNVLWSGFGGLCETHNDGDPIVRYDQLANRWIFTQFAFETPPFYQCVAVSTGPDATGSYYRYQFQLDAFNDYTKLAVWPDAYYFTANMSNNGDTYYGPRVCAFERAAMLAGKSAAIQCAQLSPRYSSLLAADLDGHNIPAANSPEYILGLDFYYLNDVFLWKYKVDWSNPKKTTMTGPVSINVAKYTFGCNSAGMDNCIPQPQEETKLDCLGDRLMYRLVYRQFHDYSSLLANHTIETPNKSTGIRWYEFRIKNNGSFNPTLYQQGTFAPDATFRFMGSIAMDSSGNIAVGYSVSSATLYPSVAFAYRQMKDPLGKMRNEQLLMKGSGVQNGQVTRWGDYSSMNIDPVDDCTFWYTNEYIQRTGSYNWSTAIANFKMPGCK